MSVYWSIHPLVNLSVCQSVYWSIFWSIPRKRILEIDCNSLYGLLSPIKNEQEWLLMIHVHSNSHKNNENNNYDDHNDENINNDQNDQKDHNKDKGTHLFAYQSYSFIRAHTSSATRHYHHHHQHHQCQHYHHQRLSHCCCYERFSMESIIRAILYPYALILTWKALSPSSYYVSNIHIAVIIVKYILCIVVFVCGLLVWCIYP